MNYIFRKKLPKYFSIEGVFSSIVVEVSKKLKIETTELSYSGATPKVIFKNLLKHSKSNSYINHISGDVHYMALVTGRNTILTIHDSGSALKGNFIKRFYVKLIWFWLPALFVKRITVISEFTKQELSKIIPLSKFKIRVVYNPVNNLYKRSSYNFNENCPVLLCVGTKENKNLERIFDAVKDVTCQLHLVGTLSPVQLKLLEENSINYVNSCNLSQEEIVKAYQNCDLLCFPSTYEGFGMPIIEAQATGRPVVTSNIGAMKEVAEDSACLVDPFDSNSIKNALDKVMSNSEYRKTLIDKGLENVKRFQLDTIANQYINIYKELGL